MAPRLLDFWNVVSARNLFLVAAGLVASVWSITDYKGARQQLPLDFLVQHSRQHSQERAADTPATSGGQALTQLSSQPHTAPHVRRTTDSLIHAGADLKALAPKEYRARS